MDSSVAAVLITAAVSIGGSWLVARSAAHSQQLAVRQAERDRIVALESRVDSLEAKREADALTKRRQGDHIDVLEHHIWSGYGPPPPKRPEGV